MTWPSSCRSPDRRGDGFLDPSPLARSLEKLSSAARVAADRLFCVRAADGYDASHSQGGLMSKSAPTAALAAALIVLCGCEPTTPAAAPVAAVPQHPDFSGLWFPAGRQQDPQRPEYTPAAAAALAEYEKAFELDDDPG